MEEKILQFVKDLGLPLGSIVMMLYFYVAKVIPAQHVRESEKDINFMKSINEMTTRVESQTRLFIDSQKSMMDSFRAENEENRKQDSEIRAHHKEVIESISQQTKESLAQNTKWLDSSNNNYQELKNELKELKKSIDEKINLLLIKYSPPMSATQNNILQ